jgi:uncharacterized protein YerC
MRTLQKLEINLWESVKKNPGLLKSILTAGEQRDIAYRLATIKLLKADRSSRQISKDLSISRQTISLIKKSLEGNEYKSYWERSKTERKKKIYSPTGKPKKARPEGRAVRTKYGIIYSNI